MLGPGVSELCRWDVGHLDMLESAHGGLAKYAISGQFAESG
jgi:hypothetical protein